MVPSDSPENQIDINPEEKEEEDYFDYYYDEPGSEPGKLFIEADAIPSRILVIDYNQEGAIRTADVTPKACQAYLRTNTVSWMDIQGLGSELVLREVGEIFHLHPLLLEDVVNVPQRPKVEEYEEQLVIIVQAVHLFTDDQGFATQQVGFVLGKRYLLTFQEEPVTFLEPIRDRIGSNQGNIRGLGPDYLTYVLLDALIDGFFPVIEDYGERIEDLENQVIIEPNNEILDQIYELRRQLLALRRAIWPLRQVLDVLIRSHNELVSSEVQIYLRDCYDHVIQLIDLVETYRELASTLMDFYISSMSNKMNEVVQLLTLISTIFIPLTFIAGVYGMNFEYMPELQWRWGYFACLGVMAAIAFSLIYYFWRKGWFNQFYSHEKIKKVTKHSQK